MGIIFARTYAREYFEAHFYNICELKCGKEFHQFIVESRRFLDDCQKPLDKNKVKSQQLLDTLNSVKEPI